MATFHPEETEGQIIGGNTVKTVITAREALDTLRGMLYDPKLKKAMLHDGGQTPQVRERD